MASDKIKIKVDGSGSATDPYVASVDSNEARLDKNNQVTFTIKTSGWSFDTSAQSTGIYSAPSGDTCGIYIVNSNDFAVVSASGTEVVLSDSKADRATYPTHDYEIYLKNTAGKTCKIDPYIRDKQLN